MTDVIPLTTREPLVKPSRHVTDVGSHPKIQFAFHHERFLPHGAVVLADAADFAAVCRGSTIFRCVVSSFRDDVNKRLHKVENRLLVVQ